MSIKCLIKIKSKCGCSNPVNFNGSKTQCSLLTHKCTGWYKYWRGRIPWCFWHEVPSSVCSFPVPRFYESRQDVHHLLPIYATYIRAGVSKSILQLLDRVQERDKKLIGGSKVSYSTLLSIAIWVGFWNRLSFNEIRKLIPENKTLLHEHIHFFLLYSGHLLSTGPKWKEYFYGIFFRTQELILEYFYTLRCSWYRYKCDSVYEFLQFSFPNS